MKPKTVGYSESHEYVNSMGLKVWVKNWYEVELDSGDSPDECHNHCKNKVQSWNEEKSNTPEWSVYKTSYRVGEPIQYDQKEPLFGQHSYSPKDPEQSIIDQINLCSSLEVLSSFKLIATKKGDRILEAYNNKLQSLQP